MGSTLVPAGPAAGELDGSGADVPASNRVYTSADYETAYHIWAGPGGRSLRKTASLTGYPLSTVHVWSTRHDWHERLKAVSEGDRRSAAAIADSVVQELITASQVPSMVALMEIVADPSHKRREVAALALLALGGRPLPKAPQITATRTLGDGSTIAVKLSDLGPLTPRELAHYARTGELPAGTPAPDTD